MFKEPLLRGIHPEGRGESNLLGISDSGVSAGFMGIPGSLAFAKGS